MSLIFNNTTNWQIADNNIGIQKISRGKQNEGGVSLLHQPDVIDLGNRVVENSTGTDSMQKLSQIAQKEDWKKALNQPLSLDLDFAPPLQDFKEAGPGMTPALFTRGLSSDSITGLTEVRSDDSLKQKNEIIDRLIDPGMSEENKQKVREAFKHSNIDQLRTVAEHGIKIFIDPKLHKNLAGAYNSFTNKVNMSPSEFADPETLKHSLNHEVLGHAYFAAKFLKNTPKGLQTIRGVSRSFIERGFNLDPNKDISNAGKIYLNFRDKVRTDKAVKIKNLNETIDKIQGDQISDRDFIKILKENNININLGGISLQKEAAKSLLNTCLGVTDVKINKNNNGNTEISFKEIPDKKGDTDLLLKQLPVPLIAAGAVASLAGSAAGIGMGFAVFGLAKLSSSICSTETKSGERELSCGNYTANIKQNKNHFTVTVPNNANITDAMWSKYAFKAREVEEYMAEGQALMNKSPESREHLKTVDGELYNYLSANM